MTDVSEKFFEHHGGSDVSGNRPEFGSSCGLEEVQAAFDELLLMPDHGAVHVALAGLVANYATGDPVWPLLVGPSGSGKTEVVTSVTSAPGVWALSSLGLPVSRLRLVAVLASFDALLIELPRTLAPRDERHNH